VTVPLQQEPASPPSDSPFAFGGDWWRRGVVYQVYPRSFADSDGDGVGDLRGLIDHLDYLGHDADGLGVDAIWLSPIYPSPGLDAGYDVADHATIDPLFGTEAEFAELVTGAHRRGIRVILDLVLNHTSDQHAWFKASRASRSGPYADWYVWRDPAGSDAQGEPLPPNNWLSFFGGSAWQFEPARGQFYLHTFLPQQPDLNWREPGVKAAQLAMIEGWLDRGVDGFRLDVFNVFVKDEELRSNPLRVGGRGPWESQVHRFDKDQPGLRDVLRYLRAAVDARPDRMTVGELFDGNTRLAAEYVVDRHLVFDFDLMQPPWSAEAFERVIRDREAAFGRDRWPTVVFSNHDQPRAASRFGSGADTDDIARALAFLQLTLRGTAFVYYGEELGLRDVAVPPEEIQDPPARRAGPDFPWWNRDQCRTPMPWTGGPGAGFTTGHPWLRLGPDTATRNVERERADPDSILALYRRLLRVRRASFALNGGTLELLPSPATGVLAYLRRADADTALVVVNFGDRPVEAVIPGPGGRWVATVSTHLAPPGPFDQGAATRLRPFEAVVFVPAPE
jgi:alpha-glucosidase